MPINFAAISARFSKALAAETAAMAPVFERLSAALKELSKVISAGERATRGYPALRYYNGALTAYVLPLGEPLMATKELGVGEGLRAAGREVVAGLRSTEDSIRQELVLPGLLGMGVDAVTAIEASIDRWESPADLFSDPRALRASALVGLFVRGFNEITDPQVGTQILQLAYRAGLATETTTVRDRLLEAPPPEPTVSARDRILAALQSALPYLKDVVLRVPVLGDLLLVLVDDAILTFKGWLLAKLQAVELRAYGLRAHMIDELARLTDPRTRVKRLLSEAFDLIDRDVKALARFVPWTVKRLVTETKEFLDGLVAWGNWVVKLIHWLPDSLVDLFGGPSLIEGYVVEWLMPDAKAAAVKRTTEAQWSAYANARADLHKVLHTPLPELDDDPERPKHYWFPDIGWTLAHGVDRLGEPVDNILRSVQGKVHEALKDAKLSVIQLTWVLYPTPDIAPAGTLRRIAKHAAATSERIFGDQLKEVRAGIQARRGDRLASAFDQAVIHAGFGIAGAAIPVYVGELRSFWASRRPAGRRPTSPHILAKRRRLVGVRVSQMTIRAAVAGAGPPPPALVAGGFHDAVGKAYADGALVFDLPGRPAPSSRSSHRVVAEPRKVAR